MPSIENLPHMKVPYGYGQTRLYYISQLLVRLPVQISTMQ